MMSVNKITYNQISSFVQRLINLFLPQNPMNKIQQNNTNNNELNLIYAYYCRLNPHKIKHKHFDQLTQKTEAMDLHQFMTFCKDISLNAKRKKNHILAPQEEVSSQSSRIQHNFKREKSNKEEDDQGYIDQYENNQNRKSNGLQNSKKNENHKRKRNTNRKIKPNFHLDQRKIAQIYKKYSSPEGEINFQGFYNIMNSIAEEMYKPKQTDKKQKQNKEKSRNSQIKETEQSVTAIQLLLQYLKLDTKQNVLQFYKKINQLHGNLDHLTLLRTPVKKIQVKNDPLGKYAGKENSEHSRLIQTINSRKKLIKKKQKTLPSLKKDNKSNYITALINSNSKSTYSLPKHADIQNFLKNHQNQIEMINKTYQNGSILRVNQQTKNLQLEVEEQILASSKQNMKTVEPSKKQKTYSQRHKIKIIGQTANSELGKLIDISDLYNDQIFNKYLQINHSPKIKRKEQTMQDSKLYKYK